MAEAMAPDESLWPFALALYARPGVEAALLELQDEDGQSIPFLIWALWLATRGRRADAAALAGGARLARAWQDAAVAPLRELRRSLKRPSPAQLAHLREALRERVKAVELEAERMLLEMLEEASPGPSGPPLDSALALADAGAAWSDGAPVPRLAALAALAG
jgi:uncharacterized protein (TIGR02444 family)